VIYPSFGNFIWSKKKHTFGGKKAKRLLQSSKKEFGAQNQYGRVIYPSIENFICGKKKYIFGDQNDKNKPSEPKNGTEAPKNQKHKGISKMHAKKVLLDSKEKNKLAILASWSILKVKRLSSSVL
jgi:hypothetical protein